MEVERKSFSGWAYLTRAEDMPGTWVAHCLDFDIVSFGDSPQHAIEMVRDAVSVALASDLNEGLDPHERRAADADWAPLHRLFEKHTRVQVAEMDKHATDFKEFAVPLTIVMVRRQHDGQQHEPVTDLDIDSREVLSAA